MGVAKMAALLCWAAANTAVDRFLLHARPGRIVHRHELHIVVQLLQASGHRVGPLGAADGDVDPQECKVGAKFGVERFTVFLGDDKNDPDIRRDGW